jgi:uncharacterized protein YbjT (DUF2867 family)
MAIPQLLEDDFPPGAYSLVGPETLGGRQCADIWASELGRPVRYVGGDKDAWHAAFARNLSGHKRTDWEASFTMLGRLNIRASKAELETTRTLLGKQPRATPSTSTRWPRPGYSRPSARLSLERRRPTAARGWSLGAR